MSFRLPFLAIKSFEKFQHYRDRNPPWIKLYTALLDDAAFLALPETAQAQLVKLWLLAARMGHPLPNNAKLLSGKIGTPKVFHLDALIAAGFIVPCKQSASDPLAIVDEDASGSVRARDERESGKVEGENDAPADAEASIKPKRKRVTWITPFADAWQEMYGGPMPIEPALKPLKSACDLLGPEEALRRWEFYLDATPGRFANAARFASTLAEWVPSGKAGTAGAIPVTDEALRRAHVLFEIGKKHALVGFEGNRKKYATDLETAAKEPNAGANFRDEFELTRMWEGFGEMPETIAVREIARRIMPKLKLVEKAAVA